MKRIEAARLMRIYIGENDRFEQRPLYEEILRRCRLAQVEQAMVYRGLEGYGASSLLHRPGLFGHSSDAPIVVTIVASPAQMDLLQPALAQIVDEGLIVISDTEIIRYQEEPDAGH